MSELKVQQLLFNVHKSAVFLAAPCPLVMWNSKKKMSFSATVEPLDGAALIVEELL